MILQYPRIAPKACQRSSWQTAVLSVLTAGLLSCAGGSSGHRHWGSTVTIDGLEAGLDADVTITGADGYSKHITASCVLTDLADGEYTVTAATVTDLSRPGLGRGNGGTLGPEHLQRHPLIPVQKMTVTNGVASATIRYPPATLTIQVPVKETPTSTVPMDFVLMPAGTFMMGSTIPADSPFLDAQPPHGVAINRAFYMARTETTQAQWKAVMGASSNPSADSTDPAKPVECVSWDMVRTTGSGFLAQLNAALPGYNFRLPSEAEWEYGCRAGTTSEYFFHDGAAPLYGEPTFDAFASELDSYGVWGHTWRGILTTSTVGSKKPNPWGLYDVIGNVIEWTEDDSQAGYAGAPLDGSPWIDAPRSVKRVQRGGSFFNYEDLCRSAVRTEQDSTPPSPEVHVGFRLAMPVP